jgi:hypothetical protein
MVAMDHLRLGAHGIPRWRKPPACLLFHAIGIPLFRLRPCGFPVYTGVYTRVYTRAHSLLTVFL